MVSMVILNYNDWELTQKYSQSISLMEPIDHIVIVDNCSSDGSYEKLKKLVSEKIDVIKTESNGGYAKGNNYGVDYIIDSYGSDGVVIISNPDIEVEEHTIINLINTLKAERDCFAVTGLVYNVKDELIPIFTWHLPTVPILFVNSCTILRNILFKMFGYGTKIKTEVIDFNQETIFCEALPGCFFVADLNKWIELEGFCEKTFLFYEEDILFTKVKKCGMRVALVPSAKIKHFEGASVGKSLKSWKKRELVLQDSCCVYMQEALHKGRGIIWLYKGWNQFWMLERYLMYRIKNMKK